MSKRFLKRKNSNLEALKLHICFLYEIYPFMNLLLDTKKKKLFPSQAQIAILKIPIPVKTSNALDKVNSSSRENGK